MFEDVLEANRRYQAEFHDPGLPGMAARGLAVVTCIDSRIDPLAMLGLRPGDSKIIRNAGARITDDALRSLIVAVNLLGVTRICIVQHTDCAMLGVDDGDLRRRMSAASGEDFSGMELLASANTAATLQEDLKRLEACRFIPSGVAIGAFTFDVRSGSLTPFPRD